MFKVFVEGQIGMPFKSLEDAELYAKHMEKCGFECVIYRVEKP